MKEKSIILVFIAFLFIANCAHQGFTKKIEYIISNGNLNSEELKELIDKKNKDLVLIDVRSEKEYISGYIPTAINIPHMKIQEHSAEIPKKKLIIVYCKVGVRAKKAQEKLMELGFENVINFGGMNSWKYELVK
jgi:rhodanese-related sulfurtransferase